MPILESIVERMFKGSSPSGRGSSKKEQPQEQSEQLVSVDRSSVEENASSDGDESKEKGHQDEWPDATSTAHSTITNQEAVSGARLKRTEERKDDTSNMSEPSLARMEKSAPSREQLQPAANLNPPLSTTKQQHRAPPSPATIRDGAVDDLIRDVVSAHRKSSINNFLAVERTEETVKEHEATSAANSCGVDARSRLSETTVKDRARDNAFDHDSIQTQIETAGEKLDTIGDDQQKSDPTTVFAESATKSTTTAVAASCSYGVPGVKVVKASANESTAALSPGDNKSTEKNGPDFVARSTTAPAATVTGEHEGGSEQQLMQTPAAPVTTTTTTGGETKTAGNDNREQNTMHMASVAPIHGERAKSDSATVDGDKEMRDRDDMLPLASSANGLKSNPDEKQIQKLPGATGTIGDADTTTEMRSNDNMSGVGKKRPREEFDLTRASSQADSATEANCVPKSLRETTVRRPDATVEASVQRATSPAHSFDVSKLLPVKKRNQTAYVKPPKLIELVDKGTQRVIAVFRGMTNAHHALGLDRATATMACLSYGTPSQPDFDTFVLRYAEPQDGPLAAYEYGSHKEDWNQINETHDQRLARWEKLMAEEKSAGKPMSLSARKKQKKASKESSPKLNDKNRSEPRKTTKAKGTRNKSLQCSNAGTDGARIASFQGVGTAGGVQTLSDVSVPTVVGNDTDTTMICLVCQARRAEIVFEPCHHCVLCSDCSETACKAFCIACRTTITGRLRPSTIRVVKPRIYSSYSFM